MKKILLTRKASVLTLLAVLSILIYYLASITLKEVQQPYKIVIPDNNYEEKNNESKVVIKKTEKNESASEKVELKVKTEETDEMKYILQWTSARNVPFVYMGQGQKGFIDRKCPHTNCFVTGDKNYFEDITKFDVIAFSGPDVIRYYDDRLPTKRKPHQKYVFASIESSDYYPVCSNRFDGYFNWTWTFRLDSEVRWGYMVIRDKNNNVIGPNKEMQWMKYEDMDPVSDEFKKQLKTKTKAAAWFVSNCYSKSKRENFVKQLQTELKKYDLGVDIYGQCGPLKCSRNNEEECYKLLKEKYYFYLSFENSYSEDYVTEKLLNAVQHNAVPIVYGAANYSRFIPDGAYLNARDLGVEGLAVKMNQLIKNPDEYADYYRWKNHYSYHRKSENVYTDEYCLFCSIMNDEQKVKERTVYQNFRSWWDPPNRC